MLDHLDDAPVERWCFRNIASDAFRWPGEIPPKAHRAGPLDEQRFIRRKKPRSNRQKTTFHAVLITLMVVLVGDTLPSGVRTVVTVLLAVSMGGQLALIRYLEIPDLLTVVLTLTITGALTERGRGRRDPAVLRRGLAVLAVTTGVIAGGLLTRFMTMSAALTPAMTC